MKPADNKVFLREFPKEETKNGIILVTKLNNQIEGEVVAKGKDVEEVEVGDHLILLKAQDTVEVNGETLHCFTINPSQCILVTK